MAGRNERHFLIQEDLSGRGGSPEERTCLSVSGDLRGKKVKSQERKKKILEKALKTLNKAVGEYA